MSGAPLSLSIITRTCNRPDALARAAAGLRSQDAGFEWVVVNDGDAPLNSDVLLGVGSSQNVVNPPERLGRSGAAQAGLDAASGDYLMLHDDDDALCPGALSALQTYLDENPAQVAVSCGYEVWHEDDAGGVQYVISAAHDLPPRLYDLAERNSLLTIGTLFRADAARDAGGIRTDIDALEDWDLWLRLMQIGDIGVVPNVLARQYIRTTDTSGARANSDPRDHELARITLQNAWLRNDIAAGRTGLGELTHRPHARFIEEADDRLRRAGALKRKIFPWTRRSAESTNT
jgi:glycosyltransferase involved in cell wall biosynthesis